MDFNIFDPAHIRDPHPIYATLREQGPVRYRSEAAGWMVTTFNEVVHVLSDHAAFSSRDLIYDAEDTVFRGSRMMMNSDAPDHSRMRDVMQPAFSGHAVAELATRVRAIAESLVRPLRQGAPFDVIGEFAIPLPVIVIAELLGIEGRDVAEFREWSDDMLRSVSLREGEADEESLRRGRESTDRIREYFTKLVDQRRKRPCDDVLTRVAQATDAGTIDPGEALANLQVLLVAGNETTAALLGSAVLTLWRHPDQRRKLVADRNLLRNAVEELLRYEPPTHIQARTATRDAEIAGVRVPAGERVYALIASANRDPRQFPEPDRFDITRRNANTNVSFGRGHHICLGAALARIEARIALDVLLTKAPEYGVLEREEELVWKPPMTLRSLDRLTIMNP